MRGLFPTVVVLTLLPACSRIGVLNALSPWAGVNEIHDYSVTPPASAIRWTSTHPRRATDLAPPMPGQWTEQVGPARLKTARPRLGRRSGRHFLLRRRLEAR